MRIDSAATAVFGVQPVMKTAKQDSVRETTAVDKLQSPFSVQLTSMVAQLSTVQASSGEVRSDKVRNISQQLANGTYNISGKDVAAKMLLALEG